MSFARDDVVVVLGASAGTTGAACAVRLLAVAPHLRVRAVVRDPQRHADALRAAACAAAGPEAAARLEVVAGDVTRPETLPALLEGAAGVVNAAGGRAFLSAAAVDNLGAGNVAAAAAAAGVRRLVLVSGCCAHPSNRWHPVRVFLNTFRKWRTLEHKWAGEERTRACGVPATVVRGPFLTDQPAGRVRLHLDVDATRECAIGTGRGPYVVSRHDLAAVCVEVLLMRPAAAGKTLTVYEERRWLAVQPLQQEAGALGAELQRVFGSVGL